MDELDRSVDALIAQRLADCVAHLDVRRSPEAVDEAPAVDVIVPLHDAWEIVGPCLAALVRNTDARHRLILIDDASTDPRMWPMLQALEHAHANVMAHRQPRNRGYLATVNDALTRCRRDVVLLNSDAQVPPGWLDRLSRAARSGMRVGIASPLSDNATLLTIAGERHLSHLDAAGRQALIDDSAATGYPRIPVAAGFCMYIRREVLDAIGDFDPAFDPGYGEETDFSLRAWNAGFEIVCCNDLLVMHAASASFGHSPEVVRRRNLHGRLMQSRWSGYEPAVRKWWRSWPLRQQSERIQASRSGGRDRALHVTHALSRLGGTELQTRALVRSLARHLDVVLMASEDSAAWHDAGVVSEGNGWEERAVNRRYHVANQRILGAGADVSDPGVERQFVRTVVGGDFRIVHFHSLLYWNSLLLPVLAKEAGCRVVVTLHSLESLCPNFTMAPAPAYRPCGKVAADAASGCAGCLAPVTRSRTGMAPPDPAIFLSVRRRLWKRILDTADAVVAPSHYVLERVAEAHGTGFLDKAHVIPHGIPDRSSGIERRVPGALLVVGFLGGQAPTKGILFVLRLAERLLDAPIRFIVRGVHARHELPMALPANLEWHGPFAPGELGQTLSELDVLLIPGQAEETFSLVLSESRSAALPVIASQRGALPERIRDGHDGWIRDPDDITQWMLLLRHLSSTAGRDDLRRVALQCASMPVRTVDQCADDYACLYASWSPIRPRHPAPANDEDMAAERNAANTLRADLARNEPDTPRWMGHPLAEGSRTCPSLHVTVLVESHNGRFLAQTLDSIVTPRGGSIAVVLAQGIEQSTVAESGRRDDVAFFTADTPGLRESLCAHARSSGAAWYVCLDAGDRLVPEATGWLSSLQDSDCAAAIADFDLVDIRGRLYGPHAQAAWDPIRAMSDAGFGHALFVAESAFFAAGGWTSPIRACRFGMQLVVRSSARTVASIPRVLVHVGDINLSPRQRDIVLNEQVHALARDLRNARVPWQVASGSAAPGWSSRPTVVGPVRVALQVWSDQAIPILAATDLALALSTQQVHVVASTDVGPGAEYLLFWRYGVTALTERTIDQLVAWVQQPGVAAAGPRRRGHAGWLSRSYAHDGLSLAMEPDPTEGAGVVGEALRPFPCAVTALSADCLLVRTELVTEHDVPSLGNAESVSSWMRQQRWRDAGREIVWVPDMAVRCANPAWPSEMPDEPRTVDEAHRRWTLASRDERARMRSQLARRPGQSLVGLRTNLPRLAVLTRDDWGSSQYRVHQPLRDLVDAGLIESPVVWRAREERVPGPFDVLAEEPDSLVLHHCFDDRSLAILRFACRQGVSSRVIILDDLLTRIPPYNPAARTVFPDIERRLKDALELSTCLVVTSDGLADEYARFAPKTMIIENALPDQPWFADDRPGTLRRERGQRRLRAGWAGAGQHAGDLQLIDELVRRRTDVDWVFMGMWPSSAAQGGAELHPPTPFHRYPGKLADLDLDIAIAPLVDNAFNRGKSRLRLLEFGALGIPVIASRVRPYIDSPATLVDADVHAWSDALDTWIEDPVLRLAEGRRIRQWVFEGHRAVHRRDLWSEALGVARA